MASPGETVAAREKRELRHELKLVCQESAWSALRMALRLDRSGVRELHPERTVQSVYLDTTYRRALEENRAGISAREKVRFRWYGEEGNSVRGSLERKHRENSLGWKETLALPEPVRVHGAQRRAFVRELARLAGGSWRERLLLGLEPAQWISYRREYLTTADGRVRLTLDRQLRFADQTPLVHLTAARATRSPRLLVLEVKCAPEALDEARQIVARLPLPIGRCSKYVLACDPGLAVLTSFLHGH